MVYYHTSKNVKTLKGIIIDFHNSPDMSPCEYIKLYIENWDDSADDSKCCWLVETFLDIMKHSKLLKEIIAQLPLNLNDQDKDYLTIILHGIIFQIPVSDMTLLYKCLFNLSKDLLNAFTTSIKNDDALKHISKIAHPFYDTNYVTKNIMGPLLLWQPAIIVMAEMYAEYLKKVQITKVKLPTIPIQPNVLNRKKKVVDPTSKTISVPATPPNSLYDKTKRMLTKVDIDKKLKNAYDHNKQKAMKLLKEVKSETYYAQKGHDIKYDTKSKQEDNLHNETENAWRKPFPKSKNGTWKKSSTIPVKDNIATLKRFNERMKLTEHEEIQWLQDLTNDCKNTNKIQELEEYDREEREREWLLDIEKKHLQGQISFEEAVLAKKKVQEENKKKYEEVVKDKELWNKEIENWNKEQMEVNRRIYEKFSLIELNVMEARRNTTNKKREEADRVKKETEAILLKALKDKQEELDRKIQMIKEIKILGIIANRAKLPKIIDLTETSGIGLLCEMSIAELQERLSSMKINLKEELELKNKLIKEKHIAAKTSLDETRKNISDFLNERKQLRRKMGKSTKSSINVSTKEINDLKTILKTKRQLRLQLNS